MNKYVMLSVKGLIGLMPNQLKSKFKRNTKLVELYSQLLHRSGLFYGRPSKKKHLAMYKKYLSRQNAALKQAFPNVQRSTEFTVLVLGNNNVHRTVESLTKLVPLSNVKVIAPASKVNLAINGLSVYSSMSSALASIDKPTFLLLLNSGDEVSPYLLSEMGKALQTNALVYCDIDFKDANGRFLEPSFFPDWNPDLHYATGYVHTGVATHSSVLTSLISRLNGKAITAIEQLVAYFWLNEKSNSIGHVAKTLVHEDFSKPCGASERLMTVADALSYMSNAKVRVNKKLKVNHVLWPADTQPLVSLIIPTKNAWQLVKTCIDSIREKTDYQNYEIILIDNGSDEVDSLRYFESLSQYSNIRVFAYPGPFNYSAINNFGVKHAKGSIIGLINNDIEVINPEWLSYMVGHAVRDSVGCVGAKLLYANERVQHAGVVLGYGGGAGHAHKYFPRSHAGYLQRLVATSNYSAVTAACLLVKRELFDAVGGLNEQHLAVAFNDVDFCLKVAELGVKNVYCAEAELYHYESVSRGSDLTPEKAARFAAELDYLQKTWKGVIKRDPFYSENLTLKRENFAIKDLSEF
ncbi:glycosyltransferase family 2 protein [Alteromonas sp. S015]|uniref:glycosyltransferase family 2 protein n=1 Tax=Alteromonas sp. S015 TaxID=3117401 RepID=UPI002FE42392